MAAFQRLIRAHRADAAMSGIIFIWGFHFIVMKDGLSAIAPDTYNALRFAVAVPVVSLIPLFNRSILRVTRRDVAWLVAITIIGPLGYQVLFAEGLSRTTSTNTALLVSTNPAWTAVLSFMVGLLVGRRQLLVGILITLAGVVLVVMGRAGASLSLSHDDLVGSLLALGSAIVGAAGSILTKPLVDRLGGMALAVWTYWLTTIGLVILAGPALLSLSAADVPRQAWPNVLYSGLLSSAFGFVAWNYALRELGPTRAATYHNFTPIIAAAAGVIVLGEPLSIPLIVGGTLTLAGVVIVRQHTFLRPRPPLIPDAPDPSAPPD